MTVDMVSFVRFRCGSHVVEEEDTMQVLIEMIASTEEALGVLQDAATRQGLLRAISPNNHESLIPRFVLTENLIRGEPDSEIVIEVTLGEECRIDADHLRDRIRQYLPAIREFSFSVWVYGSSGKYISAVHFAERR